MQPTVPSSPLVYHSYLIAAAYSSSPGGTVGRVVLGALGVGGGSYQRQQGWRLPCPLLAAASIYSADSGTKF